MITPELAKLFPTEFQNEIRRLSERSDEAAVEAAAQLREVDEKIETLARNMLVSEASPTLHRMLADLEQERTPLARVQPLERPTAEILPHPALIERFSEKIGNLSEALSHEAVRPQTAELMSQLIKSVTIYPGDKLEAEGRECSAMVVAGVGFEPTTFRL